MKLQCLGSSSSGNCYILEAANERLIIEAGIPLPEIKKALQWQLRSVAGCLVTHRHNDHSKYLKDVIACGIKVFALRDVFDAKEVRNRAFCREIEPMHGYKIGGFKVLPLAVNHDVPCVGFLIEHQEMGRLLFVTDTMMFGYIVPGLNHIMIEANYADDIVERNIANGRLAPAMRSRLFESHLELGTTKQILRRQDLQHVHNIVLLHLSNGNSDEQRFIREVRIATGCTTYAATTGMTIELSDIPY